VYLNEPKKRIAKKMKRGIEFVRRWCDRADEVLTEGHALSRRKGKVGRKPTFSKEERVQLAKELMGTTQIALARKLGITPKTLRTATRRSKDNPQGTFPYAPKTTPRATPETQEQAFQFTSQSIIGKAARGSEARWKRFRKKVAYVDHSPVCMSGKINRTHDPQWRTLEQFTQHGIAPSSSSSKSGTSYMAFTCMAWEGRALHLHVQRRRKKKTWNATPHYKLEKESVTGAMVVKAIHETLGPAMQELGIKWVYADNDNKLHQKQVIDAWQEYGIKVHPGAGKRCWDRAEGGFPVDYPELMPLDRSIHHKWKNAKNGGLYSIWNKRKPSRRNAGAFMNDIKKSWSSIPQIVYQNAIEGTRKVIQKCHDNRGKIRM